MKKTKKMQIASIVGIIVIAAMIGFGFTGCDDPHVHDWNWQITTYPTAIPLNGTETRTCTACGETAETRALTEASFKPYFYGTWDGVWLNSSTMTDSYEISSGTFKATRTDSGANAEGQWFNMNDIVWSLGENPRKNNPGAGNDLGVTVGYIINCPDESYTHLNWQSINPNPPRFIGFAPNSAKLLVNLQANSTIGGEIGCERQ
ncbi:MAG: hypothetical protein FWB86_08060 [Treponema sp.]|nr:hypothetical protein [Treponema sp.]MCL2251937.1 hypothetical protein [Treponema sp.]